MTASNLRLSGWPKDPDKYFNRINGKVDVNVNQISMRDQLTTETCATQEYNQYNSSSYPNDQISYQEEDLDGLSMW